MVSGINLQGHQDVRLACGSVGHSLSSATESQTSNNTAFLCEAALLPYKGAPLHTWESPAGTVHGSRAEDTHTCVYLSTHTHWLSKISR